MLETGVMNDCWVRLKNDGLLLKSDQRLPSVAGLVAGEAIRGSWWAHPAAHAIFHELQRLAAHPDVLIVKLIAGKDTLVHRRLWPELLAIARSAEPWQIRGVPAAAQLLYEKVRKSGALDASGAVAKLLESRLLVHGEQFHSETGSHNKRLESWTVWAKRAGIADAELPSPSEARRTFEAILPGAKWPWPNAA
jgi:hypothetical protein